MTPLQAVAGTDALLKQWANAYLQNCPVGSASASTGCSGAAGLDLDQWTYYWNNETGNAALTSEQGAVALASLGLSSRSQPITIQQFYQSYGIVPDTGALPASGSTPAQTVPGGSILPSTGTTVPAVAAIDDPLGIGLSTPELIIIGVGIIAAAFIFFE